jgi:iron complex outermembrane receptor protein
MMDTPRARPWPAAHRCGFALLALATGLALSAGAARAAMTEADLRDLARLSLEDLMQIEVTSVAGVAQSRQSAPAALTVITAEDIRRAGHRNLAEALRLVPGMYVARVNSSSWLIGSRGLTASALTANRYLVLVDGRVAHDPLLSSTFWDVTDLPLDNIDRIEVIRGPGATLWGANAMNGVISVITRDARDSTGSLVRVGGGDYERAFARVQHGAATATGAYRVFAGYDRRGDFENAAGASIQDQWSSLRGGFRADLGQDDAVYYTVLGQVYTHPTARFRITEPVPGQHLQTRVFSGDDEISGGHLLLRARHDDGQGRGWSAQAYYDRSSRDNVRLMAERDSYDLDFRRWARWGERHDWIWGLQYSLTSDRLRDGASLQFDPDARSVDSFNAFVQNTTELVQGRWYGMLGTKLTEHEFVGWNWQPAARLWWTPNASHTVWGAVSRPVRVPSRLEENGALVFSYVDTGLLTGRPASGIILPLALSGDDRLPVEELTAWELGHRYQSGSRWSIDTSLFYNDYSRLISVPPGIFGSFNALGSGRTWGGDVSLALRPTERWALEGSWSWLRVEIDGPVLPFDETSSPRRLAQLHSHYDLGDRWEINAAVYHVDEIERTNIDAYQRLDLGVTWKATPRLEFALWGQNLTDPAHAESSGAQVPRSLYLQATYRPR